MVPILVGRAHEKNACNLQFSFDAFMLNIHNEFNRRRTEPELVPYTKDTLPTMTND